SYHAFSECDVTQAEHVLRLPRELDSSPFPGEALGCAMNIFQRAEVAAGQTVAIVGVGFLGAILTKLAADEGARVIGISRRPFALRSAERFGAELVLAMHDRAEV